MVNIPTGEFDCCSNLDKVYEKCLVSIRIEA